MPPQESKSLWLRFDWATTELPASDTEDGKNKKLLGVRILKYNAVGPEARSLRKRDL